MSTTVSVQAQVRPLGKVPSTKKEQRSVLGGRNKISKKGVGAVVPAAAGAAKARDTAPATTCSTLWAQITASPTNMLLAALLLFGLLHLIGGGMQKQMFQGNGQCWTRSGDSLVIGRSSQCEGRNPETKFKIGSQIVQGGQCLTNVNGCMLRFQPCTGAADQRFMSSGGRFASVLDPTKCFSSPSIFGSAIKLETCSDAKSANQVFMSRR